MDDARFWQLLAVFVAVNAVAAALNHIDDTDETYGYYEPLHFMMYGYGFQTWEYAHEFGLRSYVFLLPMALVGQALQAALSLSKVQTF
jgi:alpha-1,2-mannosyltransferase